MDNVGIVHVRNQNAHLLGHLHGIVVHPRHLRLAFIRIARPIATRSTGTAGRYELGSFVGSVLPSKTCAIIGILLLIVRIESRSGIKSASSSAEPLPALFSRYSRKVHPSMCSRYMQDEVVVVALRFDFAKSPSPLVSILSSLLPLADIYYCT